MKRVLSLHLAILAIAAVAFTTSARADVVVTDPSLPTIGNDVNGNPTGYLTPQQVHAMYPVGPGLLLILSQAIHRPFSLEFRTQQGLDEIERFNSTLNGMVSLNGGPDQPASANGPVQTIVHGKIGNVTGTFLTEMLSLDLNGTSPFGPFLIRESPTLQSTGQTKITDNGGGTYRIDSFFDIFTEISIDGGASWTPDVSGPARVNLASVPEPTSASLLGLAAFGALARRWRKQA